MGRTRSDEICPQAIQIVVVEPADALEIARIAHVHGVRQGRHGGPRCEDTALQILGDDVVDVGGSDEAGAPQTESFGEQACREVAEIAAGGREQGALLRG